jgi:hypothetical protein
MTCFIQAKGSVIVILTDSLTTAMDRHTEAVDVYSILKPVFFVPKVLGLSPYNAVGDIGNRRVIVTVSARIYSIGMLMLTVGAFAYFIFPSMFQWENICHSSEKMLLLGIICHALSAYCTCLLGFRKTARQFEKLNNLVGKTYCSVWRRDVQLLLAMQILFVIMIVTAGVLEISQGIGELYDFHSVLFFMLYYVADFASFMSEYQFIALMHILKRTVQNWNNHVDCLCENEDVINIPLHKNLLNGQKSGLFTVSKASVTSRREKIHSNVVHFKQLRELHTSSCDIAESFNALYSPMLLLSVAKSFTTLTHTLHGIVLRFIVNKGSFNCKYTGNNSYCMWLIIYSLRLIWLVHFTADTAKEVSHKVQQFNLLHIYRFTNVQLVSVIRERLRCFVLQIVSILQLQQDVAFHC